MSTGKPLPVDEAIYSALQYGWLGLGVLGALAVVYLVGWKEMREDRAASLLVFIVIVCFGPVVPLLLTFHAALGFAEKGTWLTYYFKEDEDP